jgi:hypothetical protein
MTTLSTLRRGIVGAAAIGGALACSPDKILEVRDPDIIDPTSVADAAGSAALRLGAIARLDAAATGNSNTNSNDTIIMMSGLLADEFRSADTFVQRDETDQRKIQTSNAILDATYRNIQRTRISTQQAIEGLKAFAPEQKGQIAEMYFVQALSEVFLAENFCNGIPLTNYVAGQTIYSAAIPSTDVYARAIAHTDTALTNATGTDALSVSIKNAASLVRGRALLDLGRFADAAAAVANVPTTYQYLLEHAQTARDNATWQFINNSRRYTVADKEATNGLDFVSAADVRVPVAAAVVKGGFDARTDLYRQNLYPTRDTSYPLLSGIEARLIEAEASLQANGAQGALDKLNGLRGASQKVGAATTTTPAQLPPLALAGTKDAQVNQLFRERAFWLFATAHRLSDLRRLVRQYQRPAESVFPTGTYIKSGGTYGTDVTLPITQPEENNSEFKGCIDRGA